MTDKINELMATEIMGLMYHEPFDAWIHVKSKKIFYQDEGGWTPTTDMNQALSCADKHDGDYVSICNTPMGWSIFCGKGDIAVVDDVSEVPLAMCTMILKNKGIKYE